MELDLELVINIFLVYLFIGFALQIPFARIVSTQHWDGMGNTQGVR